MTVTMAISCANIASDMRIGTATHAAPRSTQEPERREQHQIDQLVEVADLVEEEAAGRQQEERDDEEALADETRPQRDDDQHHEERAEDGERHGRVEPVVVVERLGEREQERPHEKSTMETVGKRGGVERGRPEVREPEARVRGQQDRQAEQRCPEEGAQRERRRRGDDGLRRDRDGVPAVACLSRGPRTLGSLDVEALPIGDVHARMPTTRVRERLVASAPCCGRRASGH